MATSASDKAVAKTDLFNPVSMSRISQVIVDQIKDLIRSGALTPGDRLPSERELCTQFGVSRVTVREALRVLEVNGLVEIRVGAHGGAYLTSPSSARLGEGLADLLSLTPVTAADVTEARLIVEIGALPTVMERATNDDVADLKRLAEEGRLALENGDYEASLSAKFHIRLTESAHNRALSTLIHSFYGPMLMSLSQPSGAGGLMGFQGNTEHRLLAEAVERRDLEEAQRVLRSHLERRAAIVAAAEKGSQRR